MADSVLVVVAGKKMLRLRPELLLGVFIFAVLISESQAASYSGAWFKVWYPDNFQVFNSMPSTTADQGYDSVFFRSPDGQVEFYMFSPQWNGEPRDIALDPLKETLRAKETKSLGDNQITWISIDAQDGAYTRSYQDTHSSDGSIRWVVGIKYSNQAAYNRYKNSYLQFKRSLKQFADG